MKVAVVDFNFLLMTKEYSIVNECTLYDIKEKTSKTFHVSCQPTFLKKLEKTHMAQMTYNKTAFHRIPIGYGNITHGPFYNQLKCDLSVYDIVLAKGHEKCGIIRDIVPDSAIIVCDLTELGCPAIQKLFCNIDQMFHAKHDCRIHGRFFKYCTVYKTELLAEWIACDKPRVNALLREYISIL
jgi:hypothetical protein